MLAIENHDRFSPGVLREIIDSVAWPNVGMCLDTVNSFGPLERSEVAVSTLAPVKVHPQAKAECLLAVQ